VETDCCHLKKKVTVLCFAVVDIKLSCSFSKIFKLISMIVYAVQFIVFCHPISYQKLKIKMYRTVILPVVLYGWETWSLTLREEHRLRDYENRVLRIFGSEREEDGSWRKLHNHELHSLYSSPNIIKVIKSRTMRWVGCVVCISDGRSVYRVLIGRCERKRPLGRPRCGWKDSIKLNLREIGINGANWIHLAQDRVQWQAFVNMVMNLQVP
jgi:hypothetical protein